MGENGGPVAARKRLLVFLLAYEEWREQQEARYRREAAAGVTEVLTGRPPVPGRLPKAVPLWENEWEGVNHEDVALAAKEAGKLGEIEYHHPVRHGPVMIGPFVRITEKGKQVAALMRGPRPVREEPTP